jgi:hypothetical protein
MTHHLLPQNLFVPKKVQRGFVNKAKRMFSQKRPLRGDWLIDETKEELPYKKWQINVHYQGLSGYLIVDRNYSDILDDGSKYSEIILGLIGAMSKIEIRRYADWPLYRIEMVDIEGPSATLMILPWQKPARWGPTPLPLPN